MTRATFIQRPVSNKDHTNQNKPVLANQLFLLPYEESVCHHDYDDHGNFRFHSHHELPRPNLIWLKTYLLIPVTHQFRNIHIYIQIEAS